MTWKMTFHSEEDDMDKKEHYRLCLFLDSLFAAGFEEEQLLKTAKRLGIEWYPLT